jgi:hypothetical protein
MDESLRLRIIGDPSGAITSLNQVNAVAAGVVGGMRTSFMELGSVIKGAIGFVAGFEAIKKGLDLASSQQSLLRVQTKLLENQNSLGKQLAGSWDTIAGTSDKYSATLSKQAMTLSINSGINMNSITQAQNLLIPNQDLLKLYQSHAGAFDETTQAAANLSRQMKTDIVGGARALARVLADPAKKLSSLTRYGFSLNQKQMKDLKATNGLMNQQKLFIKDINSALGGVADASIAPMDKLKNDFNIILMALGTGFLPIIEAFATILGKSDFVNGIASAFQQMAKVIAPIAESMGNMFGKAVTAMLPLLNLLTDGLLPNIMKVAAPFVDAATTIMTAIGKIFADSSVKETVNLMGKMAETLVKDLTPTFKILTDVFAKMSGKGGALTQFFQSLVQSLTIMAPLLPAIVNLFAQLIVLSLPMMQTMLPVMAVIIRFVARIAAGIGHVLDFARKVIGPFHAIFTGIAMAVGVVAAVWFTRRLFIDPIRAAIAQIRSLTSYFLKMGIVGKEAFAGLKGEKGMHGGLHGLGQGRARAEQYLLEQQAGMRFSKGEINQRGYRREMRRISMQGPVFEEELKRLRRTSNPLYGKAFGGEGGNLISRLRTTLLGPNKQVLEGLMSASKRFEQGEDENVLALNKNTEAILTLHSKMSGTNKVASKLGGVGSSAAEVANADFQRTIALAKNPAAYKAAALEEHRKQMMSFEGVKAAYGMPDVVATSSKKLGLFGRMTGRLGGGIGKMGGMFGGMAGKVGSFGGKLGGGLGSLAVGLSGKFGSLASSLAGKFGGMASGIGSKFGNLAGSLGGKFGSLVSGLGGKFGSLAGSIGGKFSSLAGGLGGKFGSMASGLSGKFGNMASGLAGKFGGLAGGLAGKLGGMVGKLGGSLSGLVGRVGGLVGRVGGGLSGLTEKVSILVGKVSGLASRVGGGFSGLGGKLGGSLGGKVGGIFGKLGGLFGGKLGSLGGKLGGIAGKVGRLGMPGKGLMGGIRGKVGGMGMLGKGLMGGAAGLATMVAGPLIAKILPKSISGVANAALGGASMGMMFGPWGAAIGAAIGALTNLFQTCKPFHKFVMDTANLIQKWAVRIWKDVLPALKIIGKIIKTVILTSVKLIILEFKIWWAVIKTVWNVLVAIGKFIWNVLVAYVKMYVQAWKDVYNAVMWVWHGIVNGGKMVWGWLKSAFDWISNAGKWVWANLYNGFVSVANMIISAWNSTLGNILGAVGIDVKVTKLTAMKVPKFHSGGIVPGSPGKEVPAILQAGETVLSMSQTRARANAGGGGQLAVHPGAVVININGSADDKVAAQIKSHVEGQFKELHRTLKGMGR